MVRSLIMMAALGAATSIGLWCMIIVNSGLCPCPCGLPAHFMYAESIAGESIISLSIHLGASSGMTIMLIDPEGPRRCFFQELPTSVASGVFLTGDIHIRAMRVLHAFRRPAEANPEFLRNIFNRNIFSHSTARGMPASPLEFRSMALTCGDIGFHHILCIPVVAPRTTCLVMAENLSI